MRRSLRLVAAATLILACDQQGVGPTGAEGLTLTATDPAAIAGRYQGAGSAVGFDAKVQGDSFQVTLTGQDGSPLYRMWRADGQVAVEVLGRLSARTDLPASDAAGPGGDLGIWNDLQEKSELLALRGLPRALDGAGLSPEHFPAARLLRAVATQVGALLQLADVPPPEDDGSRAQGDLDRFTQALSDECRAKQCPANFHKVVLPGGSCTCRANVAPPPPPPPGNPGGGGRIVPVEGEGDHPGCSKVPHPETKCVVVSLWCRDHWKCPDPRDLRGRDEAGSWYPCGACFGFDW